ncbi:MAG: UDP-N-acetylmuramoyl-L-alanyl-D-glutamate--2,6-diaminopimelate ligase [Anaerolineales bacterium]
MTVELVQLLSYLPSQFKEPKRNPLVHGIALDSRQVKPGYLFVALVGLNQDGHLYIDDAINRGAVAIIGTRFFDALPVPYVQVDDGREALAILSAAFYSFPARKMVVIGVTGTDGKTTTANVIYHILHTAGFKVGMISTVNAQIGDVVLDTGFHVTTPEAPDVQRYLAQMVDAGLTHVVLEVTSHGLEQKRVASCEFDLGVVTNIAHEHLDFHGSYAAYRAAKAHLFTALMVTRPKPGGSFRIAVLNRDDISYEYLTSHIRELNQNARSEVVTQPERVNQIDYGIHPESHLRAEHIESTPSGMNFTIVAPDVRIPIKTDLLGDYNVSNILAAVATTMVGLDVSSVAVKNGIKAVGVIPGRMERVEMGQGFVAIVDFAHTPNALRRALSSARQLTEGRVIVVFGSAGLRDRAKRRMMAEISSELADLSVFTAEDPRTESLDAILMEMAQGAESQGGVEGESYWRIPDRGGAICFALELAQPGDLVITCGKGHEQSMCFGETEYPWDDRVAMRAALSEYLQIPGPKMPYLPTSKSR